MSVIWCDTNVKFIDQDVIWTSYYERELMSERNYQINEAIEIIYQAPNKESGLTGVTACKGTILLPSGVEDSNFPEITFVERGSSGTYHGEFTPDAVGDWQVIVAKSDGDGQVTKRYSVGSHNVSGVGAEVVAKAAITDGKVDAVDTKIDALNDISTSDVDTAVDTRADVTDAKIDALDVNIGKLDTPPMVS